MSFTSSKTQINNNMKKQICQFCLTEFENKRDRSYCSCKCYHKSQVGKKRVIRYCINCNQIIQDHHPRKFCSRICYYKHPKPKETRQKMSESHKDKPNSGWFKKGEHRGLKYEFKEGNKPIINKKRNLKLSKTRKRLYKEGKIKNWNDGLRGREVLKHYKNGKNWNVGLTAETDERVRRNAKSIKKSYKGRKHWSKGLTKETDERLMKMSKKMKAQHLSSKTEFQKGKKHPMWAGGISFEPYGIEFNNKLKEQIRKRDNFTCQECGKSQLKRKLSIHHIDYNKNNNSEINLISLCNKCHMKTNENRKHWEEHFKMKMFIKELFNPENILIYNENKQLIGIEKIK